MRKFAGAALSGFRCCSTAYRQQALNEAFPVDSCCELVREKPSIVVRLPSVLRTGDKETGPTYPQQE